MYESKGKLFAQKPVVPPGLPPEMLQKAKEKREKEQRLKQQREAEGRVRPPQNPVPGILILQDESNKTQQQPRSAKPVKPKKKAVELPDILLEQKQRDELRGSRQQPQAQSLSQVPTLNKSQPQSAKPPVDDVTKAVNELHLGSSACQTPHTDLSKKLRKLRKKIREIEVIEERLRSNDAPRPDKDQIEKAKRKPEILKEINELEMLIPK